MIKEDNLILSIAGHDPTGGAGIQVDAQIANFHGKHCLSILTCETVQNLNSFEKLIPQEKKYIQKAYKSLLKNFSMKTIIMFLIIWKKMAIPLNQHSTFQRCLSSLSTERAASEQVSHVMSHVSIQKTLKRDSWNSCLTRTQIFLK